MPLAIAAVSAVVLGALLWRAAAPAPMRAIPDSSASSAALVPGLAMLALAPAAGVWLALLGAGVTVLAAAGLVREWIGLRRRRPLAMTRSVAKRRAGVVAGGLAVAAVGVVMFAGPAGAGSAAARAVSPPDVALGRVLFVRSCSSCHGFRARGVHGVAPSLVGVGALAADFELSTGRMPLPSPNVEPVRGTPAFDPREQRALVSYIASLGGPPASACPHRRELDQRRTDGVPAVLRRLPYHRRRGRCHPGRVRTLAPAGDAGADCRSGAAGPVPDAAVRLQRDLGEEAGCDRRLRGFDPKPG